MNKQDFKVCVIGLGHAGLPLTCVIANGGVEVHGYDLDLKKIEQLNKGINPIPQEPGIEDILKSKLNKNLFFTNSLTSLKDKVNVYIIIVPLFISENKVPEFEILDSAYLAVSKQLKKGDLVVLETTVPPGTTENRFKKILESNSGLSAGKDFYLSYSPERIMTGYSISRYKEFPKVISGYNTTAEEKIYQLYSLFCNELYLAKSMREAELIKVVEGIYRDVNIGIANELYKVCDFYDVDYHHMKNGAKHQYCNLMEPGLGVSGHCIPVYPWFVIYHGFQNDMHFNLMSSAREVNDSMVDFFINKILKLSLSHKIKKIGVVGLAYREGVDSLTYARSIPLVKKLKELNYNVLGFDDNLNKELVEKELGIKLCEQSELDSCDLIIIVNKLQKHKQKLLDLKNKKIILDPKRLLE